MQMSKNVIIERNIGLDLLKIIASFAVVVLHVSGMVPTVNVGYCINNALYYMAGFAVPVFFMVNGYSLLSKQILSYRYILKKISSVLLLVFSWNVILFFVRLIGNRELANPFLTSLNCLIQKDYFWQFWFFGALIIIYLVLPVIHKYFRSFKFALIITGIFIVICFITDGTSIVRSCFGLKIVQSQVPQAFRLWTWFAYYLLGGLLAKKQLMDYIIKHLNISTNWLILTFSLIIISVYQYNMGHLYKDIRAEVFYDNIFTFIYATSLFILICRQNFATNKNNIVKAISSNVMGIYIIHVTTIALMASFFKFNTQLTNVFLIFIVFIVSLIASATISKIPLLNKLVNL